MGRLPTHRAPIHPGEILLEEFIIPLGYNQAQFARLIDWTPARLNEIVKGKRGISYAAALDLADTLGCSPEVWIGMQSTYDLWHAKQTHVRKAMIPKAA